MGGFERGNDPFGAREEARGIESGLIRNGGIFGAALVGEPGVFGADGGVVEACRNRMRGGNLAVFVLQNVGISPLQNAGTRARKTLMRGEASSVFSKLTAAAAGFNANHLHIRIAQEIVEKSDR